MTFHLCEGVEYIDNGDELYIFCPSGQVICLLEISKLIFEKIVNHFSINDVIHSIKAVYSDIPSEKILQEDVFMCLNQLLENNILTISEE